MRKWMLLAGLVMTMVMGISLVQADDGAPKPGTSEDNECNPGGVLYREENQDGCPTVWYWKAGWFLARFNQGKISRADFPTEFESALPPLSETVLEYPCWPGPVGFHSLKYTGPANTLGNFFSSMSTDCSGTHLYNSKVAVIFANSIGDADAICNSLGRNISTTTLNNSGYSTAPANAYWCQIA